MPPQSIFILLAPFIIGLVVWIVIAQERRRKQNFTNLANALGLESPDISRLELTGLVRGKRVRFTEFTTGGGKNRHTWAEVAAAVNSGGFTFILRPENIGWKLLELVGVREVKIGDAAFDDRWRISSSDPDLLRALLLDELRSRINQAADEGARGEYRIEDGWVLFRVSGNYATDRVAQQMQNQFPLIRDLADAVDVATENRK